MNKKKVVKVKDSKSRIASIGSWQKSGNNPVARPRRKIQAFCK